MFLQSMPRGKKGIAPEIIFKINFADIKKIPTFAVPSETKEKTRKDHLRKRGVYRPKRDAEVVKVL